MMPPRGKMKNIFFIPECNKNKGSERVASTRLLQTQADNEL
jgi:hypothetical protein